MTKADAGKKVPAMPIFWFHWCVFDDENDYKILITSSKVCSWIYDCVWHCDCKIPQEHESLPSVQIHKACFYFIFTNPFT